MRKKPVWRRYAFYLILAICHPAALVLLWYWLPVIALLEDPIFRDDGAAYGEEERIPPSVHTKLDDMRRELRRSGIRYGRPQHRRPERRVLSHPRRIKRTGHEDGGGKAAPGDAQPIMACGPVRRLVGVQATTATGSMPRMSYRCPLHWLGALDLGMPIRIAEGT